MTYLSGHCRPLNWPVYFFDRFVRIALHITSAYFIKNQSKGVALGPLHDLFWIFIYDQLVDFKIWNLENFGSRIFVF